MKIPFLQPGPWNVDKYPMSNLKTKVLIASTDPYFLSQSLTDMRELYNLQLAATSEVASFLIKEWEPQMALIDGDSLMINSLEHIRFLAPIRKMGLIVMSSSMNQQKEEKAFREGSDYFLSTKISSRSLQLRIESLLRRLNHSAPSSQPSIIPVEKNHSTFSNSRDSSCIKFMDISIFPQNFLVKRHQQIINTTPTQFKLLLAFISQPEHLLTRNWLKEQVWDNADISHRSIDAQISKLKKQIPELGKHLINIYGKGYMLTIPQREVA